MKYNNSTIVKAIRNGNNIELRYNGKLVVPRPNLIRNSNFAIDSLDGYGVRGAYNLSIDKVNTFNGVNTLKSAAFALGQVGTDMTMTSLVFPTANTDYVFSFYAKALAPTLLTARWGYGDSNTGTANITTTWQKFSMIVRTGAAAYSDVLPYLDQITTVWFALLKLEKGNELTDWVL